MYFNPWVVFPSVAFHGSKYILSIYVFSLSCPAIERPALHISAKVWLQLWSRMLGMAAFISLCYRSLQSCIDFVIHLSVHPYRVNRNCSSVLLIAATASWCASAAGQPLNEAGTKDVCTEGQDEGEMVMPYLAWGRRHGQKEGEKERQTRRGRGFIKLVGR